MNKAIQNGDDVFSLQCSGPPTGNCNAPGVAQCFTGKDSAYDVYGSNGNCTNMGDAWTNQVYTLSDYQVGGSRNWSGGVDTGNYKFFQGLDSGGNDIGNQTPQDVQALLAACDRNPNCRGFNTNGWVKYLIKPQRQWYRWSNDPSQGSYFKK